MILNVASHLDLLASAQPQRTALITTIHQYQHVDQEVVTFAELADRTSFAAHFLQQTGIHRGMHVAVMIPPSLDFFVTTFALFRIGAVPVLIDPGMGLKNLGKCLTEAMPEALIGIPKAHIARKLFRWAKRTIKITISTRKSWFARHFYPAFQKQSVANIPCIEPNSDEIAAILFTSGSTGVAKGVVYTHGMFANQVEMIKQLFGIEPGEVDLCTFPLFALFGPALGMTSVIPDMNPTRPAEANPAKLVAEIREFGVSNMFGSPALLNTLSIYCEQRGIKLHTLRRIISAGAPVSSRVLERMSKALAPDVEIFTPYGATESLPVACIGSLEILEQTKALTEQGRGVCIGRPVPGMRVEIIPIHDEPQPGFRLDQVLPQDEIGEIVVNGPVVSQCYFGREQANQLAKMQDDAGNCWHRMGDVGYFDAQGRLWFCGRKSHRVVLENRTLFTIPVEAVFNTHPKVFRTALVGIQKNGTTIPVLCVELLKDFSYSVPLWSKVVSDLKDISLKFTHTAGVEHFLYHKGFPVDIRHNAKIFREKLAVWAARVLR
ncbi:MAG: fatty acid CoA ligase family protein [Zavarzinella sp.]